jgi:hypothetical protein
MKIRVITTFFLAFFVLSSPFAQDAVSDSELEEHLAPVDFINNENIPSRIDTRLQIWQIGNSLGLAVKNGAATAGQTRRYFVIHCAEDESGRLTADIFGLGPDVGVDHIRNLRTIIQGYLEGAYEYSPQDAALLAQYITVYNAVFRGNADYASIRYNDNVAANLVPQNIGLDTNYNQWPGRTLMLIPIGNAGAGSLSAVNTTPLTEPQVIEELRKENDKSLPERKDMVELKEREAEEAEKKAAEQTQAADKEEAAIIEEKKQIEQEKERLLEEKEQLLEEKETADPERRQELEQKEQELEEKEQELEQKEQELDRRAEEVSVQREEAQKDQDLSEQKTAEAQQERKDIAADQQGMITDEPEGGAPVFLLGVVLNDTTSPLGGIVRIGVSGGYSELASVNVRTLTEIGDAVYALSPEGDGSYRLVKIAVDSLQAVGRGTDPVSADSLLWSKDTAIYALVSTVPGEIRLALFDEDLQLKAQSEVAVHPFAAVLFNKDLIITQRGDGQTLYLNPDDLTEVGLADVN